MRLGGLLIIISKIRARIPRPLFDRAHNALNQRIEFIDGLRGVAIALVVLFHAYARWPEGIIPYGGRFASIPLFSYGWLGVELFFLISGFVIVMTLEKCPNLYDFLGRRWLRLFPAMLICSFILFEISPLLPESPALHLVDAGANQEAIPTNRVAGKSIRVANLSALAR
jgi:peptidoglycan/LPS O-acetylase OafA/YrhL